MVFTQSSLLLRAFLTASSSYFLFFSSARRKDLFITVLITEWCDPVFLDPVYQKSRISEGDDSLGITRKFLLQ